MKNLVLILALIILIPCSSFGLEMLSDSTMEGVTGQAGVNIAMDDIQLFINIEKMAWIDCDGFASWEGKGTCSGDGGAIFLNNFQIDVLNINAITGTSGEGTFGGEGLALESTDCGNIPLFYDYSTEATGDGCFITGDKRQTLGLNNYYDHQGGNSAFVPHFLTIDVTDELPVFTAGQFYSATNAWTVGDVAANGGFDASGFIRSIGGVLIGIPTVEIYINAMAFTPMYDGNVDADGSTAANDDDVVDVNGNHKTFGTIYMQGMTFTTLSGWLEIAPK